MPRRFGLSAGEMQALRSVRIAPVLRQQLIAYAGAAACEVCAALHGTAAGPVLDVAAWRPVATDTASAACFAVRVADFLGPAASAGADPGGAGPAPGSAPVPGSPVPGAAAEPRRLVGLFHSHPGGGAVPSELDCLGIARLPFAWAIAGLGRANDGGHAELRFFTWSPDGVRELPAAP